MPEGPNSRLRLHTREKVYLLEDGGKIMPLVFFFYAKKNSRSCVVDDGVALRCRGRGCLIQQQQKENAEGQQGVSDKDSMVDTPHQTRQELGQDVAERAVKQGPSMVHFAEHGSVKAFMANDTLEKHDAASKSAPDTLLLDCFKQSKDSAQTAGVLVS